MTFKISQKILIPALLCALGIGLGIAQFVFAAVPKTYHMSDPANWNIRLDGPTDTQGLTGAMTYAALAIEDMNNDGEEDLILGSRRFDANGRIDSGSTFIVSYETFESLTSTGNIIDLNDPQNYSLRIDGAAANDEGQRTFQIADLDEDGKKDLIFVAYKAEHFGRTSSGIVYVVSGTILDNYWGTGNALDLADPSNYTLRIIGPQVSITSSVRLADFDSDGNLDFFITSPYADYRPADLNSGSVYLVLHNIFAGALNGTGTDFDLENTAHFTTRIDGSVTTPDAGQPFALGGNLTVFDSFTVGDFDGDDKPDLVLSEPPASHQNRLWSSSLYLISNDLLPLSGTGNIRNLDMPEMYTMRYDGSTFHTVRNCSPFYCGSAIGYFGSMAIGDVDGDEEPDLIFAEDTSHNGRPFSGSTYVMNANILQNISGSGNVTILDDPNAYWLRFDGAETIDRHTNGGQIRVADVSNDGRNDLILSAVGDHLSEFRPGKIYVIFEQLYSDYDPESTGNIIDLADENNWSFRYDGASTGDWLGASAFEFHDVNEDGALDLVTGAWGTDYTSNGAGSAYVVYYFPHEIEFDEIFLKTSGNPFNVTGTVHAPNNSTYITAVQWGHDRSFGDDSGEFHATWKECTPIDGAFDSNEEPFNCAHRALNDGSGDPHFASPHTVFFRARDSKGIYTPIANYPTETYLIDSPISDIQAAPLEETALISWNTSEPGSSRVEYGLTTGYGSQTIEADTSPRIIAHSVNLSDLTCGSTYHYRVLSTDVGSNTASGLDNTFSTTSCPDTTPPVISNIFALSVGKTATITWTTNEAASSQVEYGLTTGYGTETTETDISPRTTAHLVLLSNLTCGKTYHYRVKSRDANNNQTLSSDKTFVTSNCISQGGGGGSNIQRKIQEDTTSRGSAPEKEQGSSESMNDHQSANQDNPENFLRLATGDNSPSPSPSRSFDWAKPYVQELRSEGILTFPEEEGDTPATRGEAIKAIILALKTEIPEVSGKPFADVPEKNIFASFLLAAKEFGIISGYPDGSFKPQGELSRAEALKVVFLASGKTMDPNSPLPPFFDLAPDAWYLPYLSAAFQQGLIKGYPDGTFKPDAPVSKFELAKLIVSFLKIK